MKRFTIIILAVVAILAGSVSCQKVKDIDKRLTQLEQTVSDLKAQVLAGAVITSVDKTDDGCTFILSNGQSYKVTNGKNGSDGEAIIADVKIEEDFIVLTLKDGETLRISYQNPLSMVTLDIVPDFDDGTVKEPKTSEAMGMKSTNFYLDISVTPAKYAEILSDTERFIHKAVFSPVQTRSGFGNAFTVSPKRVTYCEGAPIPFLQASFELDDESAAVLQNTPYTVSYSIEDKDGVHGAATAFVTISHEKGSAPDVPTDGLITHNSPVGTIGMLDGVEGIVVELPAINRGGMWPAQPAKKVVIATKNIGAEKPEDYGKYYLGEDFEGYRNKDWYLPNPEDFAALMQMTNKVWYGQGYKWTFSNTNTSLLLPAAGWYSQPQKAGSEGLYYVNYFPEELFGAEQGCLGFTCDKWWIGLRNTGDEAHKGSLRLFHAFPNSR